MSEKGKGGSGEEAPVGVVGLGFHRARLVLLRTLYEETGAPLYAWEAYQTARAWREAPPEWVLL